MSNHTAQKIIKSSGLIFFISVTLVGCSLIGNGNSIDECKNLVKERLRSPSSAEFSEVEFNNLDGKSFEIVGQVDSQNGFGAMLRGSFKCMGYEDEELRLIYVN
jgi:hypothetical protein